MNTLQTIIVVELIIAIAVFALRRRNALLPKENIWTEIGSCLSIACLILVVLIPLDILFKPSVHIQLIIIAIANLLLIFFCGYGIKLIEEHDKEQNDKNWNEVENQNSKARGSEGLYFTQGRKITDIEREFILNSIIEVFKKLDYDYSNDHESLFDEYLSEINFSNSNTVKYYGKKKLVFAAFMSLHNMYRYYNNNDVKEVFDFDLISRDYWRASYGSGMCDYWKSASGLEYKDFDKDILLDSNITEILSKLVLEDVKQKEKSLVYTVYEKDKDNG